MVIKKEKNMKGTTDTVIIALALGVTVLIGLVYYLVFSGQSARTTPFDSRQNQFSPTPTISDSDDLETLETELNSTTTGSFESDIQKLEEDASSL